MPDPEPDHIGPADWIHQLYPDATGWLTTFSADRDGNRWTDWAPADDPATLADAAAVRSATCDVWFGVATRRERLGGGLRGSAGDCSAIPGLWVDIDIAGIGHHQGGRLATDDAHAHRLVGAFPLPPTAVVHSGGGLQAWWLFGEMIDIDDTTRPLLASWGYTWATLADQHGIDVDNVFEVARVMRLPGTVNRKEGGARPVVVLSADWSRRYGLDDLEQHLSPPPAPPAHRKATGVPYIGPERPGDAYNVRHSGGDVLARHGFTLARTDRNGDEHWTRPGKESREGTSATVYGDDGHTTVWSDTVRTMWPSVELRRPYDPFGLYTAIEHGGDFTVARATLTADGYGEPLTNVTEVASFDPATPVDPAVADEQRADWAPVDLAAILSGDHQPPAPTILRPRNTAPLLYAGRTNAIFGESGAGKTWIALAAVAEVINDGGMAVLIDLEDNAHGATSRLTALGLTTDQLLHRFIYLSPQTGWGPVAQAAVAALIDLHGPELVVLDSTGEAMAASGVKGNDDDDVARWFVTFPKFIARRGPAVVIIDHVPKDPNAPTKYMIGSQRKTAAIDGASYRVDAVKAPSRTSDGLLKIIVAKDRNGTRSAGDIAAMATVAPGPDGGVAIDLVAHEGPPLDPRGKPRYTIYMERVSRLLEETPGLCQRDVESRCEGKAKAIRDALRSLIDEGYVDQNPASRGFSYVVTKPYRESDDSTATHAISSEAVSTASHRVPTASPPRGRGHETTASPAPSPTGQGRGRVPSEEVKNESTASPQIDAEGTRWAEPANFPAGYEPGALFDRPGVLPPETDVTTDGPGPVAP